MSYINVVLTRHITNETMQLYEENVKVMLSRREVMCLYFFLCTSTPQTTEDLKKEIRHNIDVSQ